MAKRDRTERHDYGCIRAHEVNAWRRNSSSICWIDKDMRFHADVEALSTEMQKNYDCNLNYVSSIAIKPYMVLPSKTPAQIEFKLKVLTMLVEVIKADKNPFTDKRFGYYGMTEQLVRRIIKHSATGCSIPDVVRRDIDYRKEDIDLLNETIFTVKKIKPEKASQLDRLYNKLVGPRVEKLFAGKL